MLRFTRSRPPVWVRVKSAMLAVKRLARSYLARIMPLNASTLAWPSGMSSTGLCSSSSESSSRSNGDRSLLLLVGRGALYSRLASGSRNCDCFDNVPSCEHGHPDHPHLSRFFLVLSMKSTKFASGVRISLQRRVSASAWREAKIIERSCQSILNSVARDHRMICNLPQFPSASTPSQKPASLPRHR